MVRAVMIAALSITAIGPTGCVVRADAGEREPCVPSQTECLVQGRPRCVDPSTDRAHCGACDSVCAPGDVCADGRCASTVCVEGERRCDETDVLVCARDRSRFERQQCDRGAHCADNGQCAQNIAQWPSAWRNTLRQDPATQSTEPWQRWGGACGATRLGERDGEPALLFTSDRTFHGRPLTLPTRGAWGMQARLRWSAASSVRVSVGAYVSIGETVTTQMHQLWLEGPHVLVRRFGQPDLPLAIVTTVDQWHDVRFEADTDNARARWLLDGREIHESPLQPLDALGPYLVFAGYGVCNDEVWAIGEVSLEEGS